MYKISHNFFADLEIFLQTLKCKKWLDENSYSQNTPAKGGGLISVIAQRAS